MKLPYENDVPFREELEAIIIMAIDTGQELLEKQEKDIPTSLKKDGSVSCDADLWASDFLLENTHNVFPDYGILNEEHIDRGTGQVVAIKPDADTIAIIDPLDATRNFSRGGSDWAILYSLVKQGKPVLGVTLKPRKGELLFSIAGHPAYEINLNEDDIYHQLRAQPALDKRALVTQSRKTTRLENLLSALGFETFSHQSGATKIVEIARGNAEFYPSMPENTLYAWDVCACHCILESAGHKLCTFGDEEVTYSVHEPLIKGGLIAVHKDLYLGIMQGIEANQDIWVDEL